MIISFIIIINEINIIIGIVQIPQYQILLVLWINSWCYWIVCEDSFL